MKKNKLKFSNIRAAQEGRLPILAIDLDGTLLEYSSPPDFGKPIDGIIEELKKLRAAGWMISIWTCRKDSQELRNYLDSNDIPYDYINESDYKPFDNSEKIQADVYLDDKAMNFAGNANGLAEKIMHFKPWHKYKHQFQDNLRDVLADYAHETWSNWMRYLFSKSKEVVLSDGSTVVQIPNHLVERWTRQINTPYNELSEKEKLSDLKEADKILDLCKEE